jgi:hypothetical protein
VTTAKTTAKSNSKKATADPCGMTTKRRDNSKKQQRKATANPYGMTTKRHDNGKGSCKR